MLASPLISACGRFPADTEGTLDRAQGGRLRIGVSVNPPFTRADAQGHVDGSEVTLLCGFCATVPTSPSWRVGAEGLLAAALRDGALDVLIGGLDSQSPWKDQIALTRPYRKISTPSGDSRELVMAVRAGENALLVALERFLAEQEGQL